MPPSAHRLPQPPPPPPCSFHDAFLIVDAMRMRDVRKVFGALHATDDADALIVAYGVTMGEFATAHILLRNNQ